MCVTMYTVFTAVYLAGKISPVSQRQRDGQV